MDINKILLNNYRLLMVSGKTEKTITTDEFKGFLFIIKECGYKLSDNLKDALFNSGKDSIKDAIDDLELLVSVGETNPFLKNFAELGNDQNIWNSLKSCFKTPINSNELIEIDLMTYEKSIELFKNKLNSKTVWSENDREILIAFLSFLDKDDVNSCLKSESLEIRENKAFLSSELYKLDFSDKSLSKLITSASDLIRFVYEINGVNIKIENFNKTRLKFSNKDIKLIFSLLSEIKNLTLDMFLFEYEFKKLARVIHPMTMKNMFSYPTVYKSFYALMNNEKPENWGSDANKILVEDDLSSDYAASVFSKRPGEFGRSLRSLLLKYDSSIILESFKDVSNEIPTKLLLEMFSSFSTNDYEQNRVTIINNKFKKLDDKSILYPITSKQVVKIILNALKIKLSKLDDMGPIVLDENLKSIPVPIQERESTSSFSVLPKLSRIKIPSEIGIIRTFVYWKDLPNDIIDLDSSLIAVNDNGNVLRTAWNTDFKSTDIRNNFMIYSGDEMSAPNGAIEYHDINLAKLKQAGYKYVVSDLRSFTGQKFSDITEACFGYQFNQTDLDAQLFDPNKVENVMSLNNQSTNITTFVIDLINYELVWINTPMTSNDRVSNNYDINLIDRVLNLNKFSIYDLISYNIEARNGTLISKDDYYKLPDEFKDLVTIFNSPERNKVLDVDNILSNYM